MSKKNKKAEVIKNEQLLHGVIPGLLAVEAFAEAIPQQKDKVKAKRQSAPEQEESDQRIDVADSDENLVINEFLAVDLSEPSDSEISLTQNKSDCKINSKGQEECDEGAVWWKTLLGLGLLGGLAAAGGGGGGSSAPVVVPSGTYRHRDFTKVADADDTLNIGATSLDTVTLYLVGSEHTSVGTDAYDSVYELAVSFTGSDNIRTFNILVDDDDVKLIMNYSGLETDLRSLNIRAQGGSQLDFVGGNYIESYGHDLAINMTSTGAGSDIYSNVDLLNVRSETANVVVQIDGSSSMSADDDLIDLDTTSASVISLNVDSDADYAIYVDDSIIEVDQGAGTSVYVDIINSDVYAGDYFIDLDVANALVDVKVSEDSYAHANDDFVNIDGGPFADVALELLDSSVSTNEDLVDVNGSDSVIDVYISGGSVTADNSVVELDDGNRSTIKLALDEGAELYFGEDNFGDEAGITVSGNAVEVEVDIGLADVWGNSSFVKIDGQTSSVDLSMTNGSFIELNGGSDLTHLIEIDGSDAVVTLDMAVTDQHEALGEDSYYSGIRVLGRGGDVVNVTGNNAEISIDLEANVDSHVYGPSPDVYIYADGDLVDVNGGDADIDVRLVYADIEVGGALVNIASQNTVAQVSLTVEEPSDEPQEITYLSADFGIKVTSSGTAIIDNEVVGSTVDVDASYLALDINHDFIHVAGDHAHIQLQADNLTIDSAGSLVKVVGNSADVEVDLSRVTTTYDGEDYYGEDQIDLDMFSAGMVVVEGENANVSLTITNDAHAEDFSGFGYCGDYQEHQRFYATGDLLRLENATNTDFDVNLSGLAPLTDYYGCGDYIDYLVQAQLSGVAGNADIVDISDSDYVTGVINIDDSVLMSGNIFSYGSSGILQNDGDVNEVDINISNSLLFSMGSYSGDWGDELNEDFMIRSYGYANEISVELSNSYVGHYYGSGFYGEDSYVDFANVVGDYNTLNVGVHDAYLEAKIDIRGQGNDLNLDITSSDSTYDSTVSTTHLYMNGNYNDVNVDLQGASVFRSWGEDNNGYNDHHFGGVITGVDNDLTFNIDSESLGLRTWLGYEDDIEIYRNDAGLLISGDYNNNYDVNQVTFNLENAAYLWGDLDLTGDESGSGYVNHAVDLNIRDSSTIDLDINVWGEDTYVDVNLNSMVTRNGLLEIDSSWGAEVTLSMEDNTRNLNINHTGDEGRINLVSEYSSHNYDNADRIDVDNNDDMYYTNFNGERDSLVIDSDTDAVSYVAFHWDSNHNYDSIGDGSLLDLSDANIGGADYLGNESIGTEINTAFDLNVMFGDVVDIDIDYYGINETFVTHGNQWSTASVDVGGITGDASGYYGSGYQLLTLNSVNGLNGTFHVTGGQVYVRDEIGSYDNVANTIVVDGTTYYLDGTDIYTDDLLGSGSGYWGYLTGTASGSAIYQEAGATDDLVGYFESNGSGYSIYSLDTTGTAVASYTNSMIYKYAFDSNGPILSTYKDESTFVGQVDYFGDVYNYSGQDLVIYVNSGININGDGSLASHVNASELDADHLGWVGGIVDDGYNAGWFDDIYVVEDVLGSDNINVWKWDHYNDWFDLKATLSGSDSEFFYNNYVWDSNLVADKFAYLDNAPTYVI